MFVIIDTFKETNEIIIALYKNTCIWKSLATGPLFYIYTSTARYIIIEVTWQSMMKFSNLIKIYHDTIYNIHAQGLIVLSDIMLDSSDLYKDVIGHIRHRTWVAMEDLDEGNQELASQLWEKMQFELEGTICEGILVSMPFLYILCEGGSPKEVIDFKNSVLWRSLVKIVDTNSRY